MFFLTAVPQENKKEYRPVKIEIDDETGFVIKETEATEEEVEELVEELEDSVKINSSMDDKKERKHNWAITIFSVVGAVLLTVIFSVLLMFKSPALSLANSNYETTEILIRDVIEVEKGIDGLRTELREDIRNIDNKIDSIYNLLLEIKQGE